jgi:hypothetical protein
MLNITNKLFAAAAATALGTVLLLAGSGYERGAAASDHCLRIQKSENGTWEYVKDWHDGYNLHKYAKIKVKITTDGKVSPQKDNATGLVVFRDVTEAEYNASRCMSL